jgi:hypothetical protein
MNPAPMTGSYPTDSGQADLTEASSASLVNKYTGREGITLSPAYRLCACLPFPPFLHACSPLDEAETLLGGRLSSPAIRKPLSARRVP